MTNIASYLRDTKTTQAAFAAVIGISRPFMSEIAKGVKKPSRSVATKIEQATKGKVKASSWDAASDYGFSPSRNGGAV